MSEVTLQACLRKIITLDKTCLPDQVMIELHAPLLHEADIPGANIVRRWLSVHLDELRSFNVGMAAAGLGHAMSRSLVEVVSRDDRWQIPRRSGAGIGLARFAAIADSDVIYMDYQWGSLCGGGGLWLYDVASHEMVGTRILWLS